jgi:hypothetical protein
LSPCPLQKLISKTIPFPAAYDYEHHWDPAALCDIYDEMYATLVCCSGELMPRIDASGPISWLSNTTHLLYLLSSYLDITDLPLNCEVVSDGVVRLPILREQSDGEWPLKINTTVERILKLAEVELGWSGADDLWECDECEHKGGRCASSSQRNQTFCMPHGILSNRPVAQYNCGFPFYFVN